ncbi:glycerophosphoryl diester phosphodiesterase [Natranaerovirga pectinivora]|uniref:Glycerophosphoryl diester phosphodiesterase n=1 Tax=Natranaerovirga pectinivora TaxID=682400 RepID=A0A4R3MMI7_9FIRM|nr:glycerophosphodiester phosphodiesterase family protein [Natranaerovirga pectinivora]TCT16165.1 glycerophosphoryl diester phosphodiesterase [Natranaerovirga pectinivora]
MGIHYLHEIKRTPPLETLIAHAGGSIYGIPYTNSLEALNNSYMNGFKLIELDFHWTTDGYPVCIHDWDSTPRWLFMNTSRQYSLEEFLNKDTLLNLTLLDLNRLEQWLIFHPSIYIIADIKKDYIRLLKYIKDHHPKIQHKFIPHLYSFHDYEYIRYLGYSYVIPALYNLATSDTSLFHFLEGNEVFAVSMPLLRALTLLPRNLYYLNVPSYAHTINFNKTLSTLKANKVTGVYTDYLRPNSIQSIR